MGAHAQTSARLMLANLSFFLFHSLSFLLLSQSIFPLGRHHTPGAIALSRAVTRMASHLACTLVALLEHQAVEVQAVEVQQRCNSNATAMQQYCNRCSTDSGIATAATANTGTVTSREIETTVFDPASQFLSNISRCVLGVHRVSLLIYLGVHPNSSLQFLFASFYVPGCYCTTTAVQQLSHFVTGKAKSTPSVIQRQCNSNATEVQQKTLSDFNNCNRYTFLSSPLTTHTPFTTLPLSS